MRLPKVALRLADAAGFAVGLLLRAFAALEALLLSSMGPAGEPRVPRRFGDSREAEVLDA